MPYKTWVVGEEVLAADFNNYIQEQVVSTWATAAARTAGITSPVEGMITYRADGQRFEFWDGTEWRGHGLELYTAGTPGGGTVGTTEAIVPGADISVPDLSYSYRVSVEFLTVCHNFSVGGVGHIVVRYNTTGATVTTSDTVAVDMRVSATASQQFSVNATAAVDRPSGGPTRFSGFAVVSAGTMEVAGGGAGTSHMYARTIPT